MGILTRNKTTFLTLIGGALVAATLFAHSISVVFAGNNHNSSENEIKVDVCHKDGQSGNYSLINVSVHSVNDANGLNGHGNHNGDIWAPFTFDGVNYDGQGNFNGINFSNCSPKRTPTPTSTPTPTPVNNDCEEEPTAIPTYTPSATPTISPTNSPIATPTASPVEEISNGVNSNDNGDGLGCAVNDCSGNQASHIEGTGTGGQVLGASTMAGTGTFAENFYEVIMGIGGTISAFGAKGFKKQNKTKVRSSRKTSKK